MNIEELVRSKKFKVFLGAVLTWAGVALTDGVISIEELQEFVKIVTVYLGSQGVADFGKGVSPAVLALMESFTNAARQTQEVKSE